MVYNYRKSRGIVKCPKCKSKAIDIIEISDGFEQIYTYENGEYSEEGILNPGELSYVNGECQKCKYLWKLRKISSWEDVVSEVEE